MKKTLYPMAMAFALLATSCNSYEDILTTDDADKDMISFSLSDGSRESRAGFTTAATRIVARFQSDAAGKSSLYTRTYLEAAVDGTNNAESFSTVDYVSGNKRYWDDAYGRAAKISVYAVAIPNSEAKTKLTDEILAGDGTWKSEATPNNNIVWSVTNTTQTSTTLAGEDLAYSNNIKEGGNNGRYVWDYTANKYPDNNGRLNGHSNGRLEFTQKAEALPSDAGHFDKGHLMFNHALSRLTVTLVEGEDYNEHTGDFKFTNTNANITLLNFPTAGILDVKAGTWSNYSPTNITTMIGTVGPNAAAGDYSAQMLPSYKFYGTGDKAATNVMQFVIDNSTYYITQKQVFDALNTTENTTGTTPKVTVESDTNGNYIEMKQGKNYHLTITVKKTKIDNVTATLAPWVEVAGAMEVNNAHIELTLKTTGATCDKDIDLYRLGDDNAGYDANNYDFSYQGKNWFGNYSTDAKYKTTLLHSALAGDKWTTPWYFESNKTYYHFRTVNKGTTIEGTSDDDVKDYFEISAGPVANTDPHWGAPMKSTSTTWLKYDENSTLTDYSDDKGYEAHLHHAIGATESQVAIQELHMMSNIEVILQTPNDGGKIQLRKDAVAAVLYADAAEYNAAKGTSLDDAAFAALSETEKTKTPAVPAEETVVKITRIAANGTVEMGRGVVVPTGAYTGELTMTNPTTFYATDGLKTNKYTYAVVPQSLSRDFDSDSDNDYIGIFIQTPDHNQYYVVKKLSAIIASSVSDQRDQTKDAEIKRWYPGHTYTYTFTISKTGINNITATVADWVTVEGKNTNLGLED